MNHSFEKMRPHILGAILDAVSAAMSRLETVRVASLPRMADSARWITSAEKHLGWKDGEFIELYTQNQRSAQALFEDSPVAAVIRRFLPPQWKGTATELLNWINEVPGASSYKRWGKWPENPRQLGNEIRRIRPNLRAAGILFTTFKSGNGACQQE